MLECKEGFYTALGTPLDANGNACKKSLETQIKQQIAANASGLLLMGSMGMEASVKNSAYADLVEAGVNANNGKLPFFVGAMDNSIAKVLEKIDMMKGAKVDGVVLTAPFYFVLSAKELEHWFTAIADKSPIPLFLYDLPGTVKHKLTYPLVEKLSKHGNIKGIKTADMQMIKMIQRNPEMKDFVTLCSNLDMFDYCQQIGITRNLDGMFSCMPTNGKKMYECVAKKDFCGARKYLDNILNMRDSMIGLDLFPAFTCAMNLLGCEGSFNPDYHCEFSAEKQAKVKELMKQFGEI